MHIFEVLKIRRIAKSIIAIFSQLDYVYVEEMRKSNMQQEVIMVLNEYLFECRNSPITQAYFVNASRTAILDKYSDFLIQKQDETKDILENKKIQKELQIISIIR